MKIFYLLMIVCFYSCVTNNSENAKLIIGEWQAVSWLVNEQPGNYKVEQTRFQFDGLNNYSFMYGGTEEKGNYIVKENKLYTTAFHQQEIMVQIEKLSSDSMIFKMNRGGQTETLILRKVKP